MPITPTQARNKRQSNVTGSKEFKLACDNIDEYLSETKLPAYWDCSDCSTAVIDSIISIYTSQGWNVEFVCDQRDGNCLKFED